MKKENEYGWLYAKIRKLERENRELKEYAEEMGIFADDQERYYRALLDTKDRELKDYIHTQDVLRKAIEESKKHNEELNAKYAKSLKEYDRVLDDAWDLYMKQTNKCIQLNNKIEELNEIIFNLGDELMDDEQYILFVENIVLEHCKRK